MTKDHIEYLNILIAGLERANETNHIITITDELRDCIVSKLKEIVEPYKTTRDDEGGRGRQIL